MSVGVVEAREHRPAFEIDDAGARLPERVQLATADRDHTATRYREVTDRPQTAAAKRVDGAPPQQQVGLHEWLQ